MVSLSGGLDSTVLLHSLWQLAKQQKFFRVATFHCAYGLRGSDSVADRDFCRELARERSLPFFCREVSDEERRARRGESVQTWARRLRREEFSRYAKEGWMIALGHHADDLAETVLMRLARGSGPGSLLGMKPWAVPYWRPLLGKRKQELDLWAQEERLSYRHDRSNDEAIYSRNVIRLKVLPELEALYPGAAERIVACAAEAQALVSGDPASPAAELQSLAKSIKNQRPDQPLSRRLLTAALAGKAPVLAGGDGVRVSKRRDIERFRPAVKATRGDQHRRGLAGPALAAILEPGSHAGLTTAEGRWELGLSTPPFGQATASSSLRLLPVASRQSLRFFGRGPSISMKNLMQSYGVPVQDRPEWLVIEQNRVAIGLFDGQTLHVPKGCDQQTECSHLAVNLRYLKNGGADRRQTPFSPEI